jgi:dTDP-4-dehydrorhamnose 3,5-epimerase
MAAQYNKPWVMDDRGYGAYDVFESTDLSGQFNISELAPNAIRAFHIHQKQTDFVFCPKGDMMVILVDGVNIKKYFIGEHNPQTIVIPPGVAHGYKSLFDKPAMMCYYVDRKYDPADEGRMDWDCFGADLWDTENK